MFPTPTKALSPPWGPLRLHVTRLTHLYGALGAHVGPCSGDTGCVVPKDEDTDAVAVPWTDRPSKSEARARMGTASDGRGRGHPSAPVDGTNAAAPDRWTAR